MRPQRRLLSSSSQQPIVVLPQKSAGLILRSLLVSSSVGLATPLFTVGGVVRLWYHIPLPNGLKYIIAIVCGGGIATLTYAYIIPFHLNHAEVIMPFAVANAVTAGALYAAVEAAVGYPAVVHLPWLGAGLGAATATIAPLLWPALLPLCLSRDFFDMIFPAHFPVIADMAAAGSAADSASLRIDWLRRTYYELLLPVGLPVSVLAGTALSAGLVPLSNAMMTHPAGWMLPAGLFAAGAVYHTLCRANTDDYWFELRVDKHGVARSVNLKTRRVEMDGGRMALEAGMKRKVFEAVQGATGLLTLFFSAPPPPEVPMGVVALLGDVGAGDTAATHTPPAVSGKQCVKDPPPCPTAALTLLVANQRAVLFPLLDSLVQHKHLQLQLQQLQLSGDSAFHPPWAARIGAVEADLQKSHQIKDAVGVILDCEAVLVGASGADAAASRLQSIARGSPSLRLLVINLPLLQAALQTELGYTVGSETSLKAVEGRRRQVIFRNFSVAAVAVASLGAALYAIDGVLRR